MANAHQTDTAGWQQIPHANTQLSSQTENNSKYCRRNVIACVCPVDLTRLFLKFKTEKENKAGQLD